MGFALTLYFGTSPAPRWVIESLDSVSVTQSDQAPNGFQLVFATPRATAAQGTEFRLMALSDLQAGKRVALAVTIDGATRTLVDGYVTHIQLQPSAAGQPAQITVTGEDVSILMDLYEYSLEYPFMPDFLIAGAVLLKWIVFGIDPSVHPSPSAGLNLSVPQQVGTDRKYLQALAGAHGYVFYIEPRGVGSNTAYWGPPPREDAPQKPLSVDQGAGSTVSEIAFSFDGMAPQRVWGSVLDSLTNLPIPVVTFGSTRSGDLATRPQLTHANFVGPFPFVRTTLFDHQGLGVLTAYARGQAITNISTDAVVTATGRIDVLRYGTTLNAPGTVALRGAGNALDGLYYVQKVTHNISRGAYSEEFVLTREGLGSTIAAVANA